MDTQRAASVIPAPSRTRIGRRAVLLGLGSLAVAGVTAGCGAGSSPSPTPQATGTAGATGTAPSGQAAPIAPGAASTAASGQAAPTAQPPLASVAAGGSAAGQVAPTAPAVPTLASPPVIASTPVALPAFSARAVAADMADPSQWNTVVLESSGRTLANNAYAVRVNKWPDGRGLLSWGDWVPRNVALAPQFSAEVEMQVTGDGLAAGGFIFLYNSVADTAKQQFLAFLIRADGRFRLVQQLPGGEGFGVPRIDWVPTSAINSGTNVTNTARVIARSGTLICGVNGRQVAQMPIPPDLAGFRGVALAADVPALSAGSEVTATFRNLRYEPFAG